MVAAVALGACSGKEKVAVTPFGPTLNRSNYKAWYEYSRPDRNEYAWTLWEWSPQLAPAARMASAEGKPVLIWLENGHPLGATTTNGIARRDWWTDVSLNSALNKVAFAADDLQWLLDSEDAEGQLIDKLLQQDDDRDDLLEHGGVLMAASSGKWLGSYSGLDAAELKLMMEQALGTWDELASDDRRLAEMSTMVSEDRPANLFPDDGLTLEVHRRPMLAAMDPTGERTKPWTHDYLWLSKSEVAPLMLTKLGQELEVPASQAQRIGLFLLVDNLYSNGESFDLEDLQLTKLTFQCISKIGSTVRFTMSGEFKAENDDRGMHCFVEGDGSLNLDKEYILSINMGVQAQSWGHSVEMPEDGTAPLMSMGLHRVNSYEGSHRITPSQFDQYPANWRVTD